MDLSKPKWLSASSKPNPMTEVLGHVLETDRRAVNARIDSVQGLAMSLDRKVENTLRRLTPKEPALPLELKQDIRGLIVRALAKGKSLRSVEHSIKCLIEDWFERYGQG